MGVMAVVGMGGWRGMGGRRGGGVERVMDGDEACRGRGDEDHDGEKVTGKRSCHLTLGPKVTVKASRPLILFMYRLLVHACGSV